MSLRPWWGSVGVKVETAAAPDTAPLAGLTQAPASSQGLARWRPFLAEIHPGPMGQLFASAFFAPAQLTCEKANSFQP